MQPCASLIYSLYFLLFLELPKVILSDPLNVAIARMILYATAPLRKWYADTRKELRDGPSSLLFFIGLATGRDVLPVVMQILRQ